MRIIDWSSDVCSSDLLNNPLGNYLCLVQAGQAKQARQQRFSDSRFNVCRVQRIFRDGALDGCLHIQRCPDKLFLFIPVRSEEHTSELQSLMRISYAVICLKKKQTNQNS